MPSAAFNKFQPFVQHLANGIFDFLTDQIYVALTNSVPLSTYGQFSQITEISAVNGYPAGGVQVLVIDSTQSGGVYKLVLDEGAVITASGGDVGPFRYAVLYAKNSGYLIGWFDYGETITLHAGEAFTETFDAPNGALQLQ